MKTYLLLIATLLYLTSYSQITIDENDFLQSEDSVKISTSTNLTLDFTTTGPNSIWDFSNLTESSQLFEKAQSISSAGIIINVQFGPFAPSEYRASYFQKFDDLPIDQLTSFLPVQINSVNRMVKINDDEMTFPGYSLEAAGQLVGFKSDTIEKSYEFPLNYGDNYSSTGHTDINLAPIYEARIIMNRQRESTVDGYGQLTTPYGTYDVLRVKHVITELDSILLSLGSVDQWIPTNSINSEYEWLAKDEKRPVMKIETETTLGIEVPTRITYINNQVSDLNENSLETIIYPNPTNGILNIEAQKELEIINVFGTDGRQVFEQVNSGTSATLNLSHLSPGMYTIQAISTKGQSFKPIVIK